MHNRIYVQAKRYGASKAVGRPEIQEFVGALQGAQADRGIFITTSRFTPEAVTYADRVAARVILIDGLALASLMVRYNIGVQDQQTYVIKRVDEDFFDESWNGRACQPLDAAAKETDLCTGLWTRRGETGSNWGDREGVRKLRRVRPAEASAVVRDGPIRRTKVV